MKRSSESMKEVLTDDNTVKRLFEKDALKTISIRQEVVNSGLTDYHVETIFRHRKMKNVLRKLLIEFWLHGNFDIPNILKNQIL